MTIDIITSVGKQGEMSEWFKVTVSKTVEVKASEGSNPSFSVRLEWLLRNQWLFLYLFFT